MSNHPEIIDCELCEKKVILDKIVEICEECLQKHHYAEFINVLLAVNKEIDKLKEENEKLKEELKSK
jgi:heme oxygenase